MPRLRMYKFDDKPWRRVTSAVRGLNASNVHAGLVGGAGAKMHPTRDNVRVWEVAAINEFGSRDGHVPERSFIRSTLSNRAWVTSVTAQAAQRVVLLGHTAHSALNWMGRIVANAMRGTIERGVPPSNAPATVAAKGHGHTLVDTRVMINAIGHEVAPATAYSEDIEAVGVGLDGE